MPNGPHWHHEGYHILLVIEGNIFGHSYGHFDTQFAVEWVNPTTP